MFILQILINVIVNFPQKIDVFFHSCFQKKGKNGALFLLRGRRLGPRHPPVSASAPNQRDAIYKKDPIGQKYFTKNKVGYKWKMTTDLAEKSVLTLINGPDEPTADI